MFIFLKYFLIAFIFFVQSRELLSENLIARIRINKGECLKCYFAQGAIDLIDKNVEIQLIFKEQKDVCINRFLKRNFPVLRKDIEIIKSDSLYEKYSYTGKLSEFFLFKADGEELFHFPVKNIWKNIQKINCQARTNIVFKIDDTLGFSHGKIYCANNRVIFNDVIQENISVFDSHGNCFFQLYVEDLDPKTLLNYFPNSSDSVYIKYFKYLEKIGRQYPMISSVYALADSLYIALKVPNPVYIKAENRLVLSYKPLVAQIVFNFNNKCSIDYFPVIENTVPENYYTNLDYIYYYKNKYIIPTYRFKVDSSTNYMIGEYILNKNGFLEFSKFIDYKLPEMYKGEKNGYKNMYPLFKTGLAYFNYSNFIFDLENSKLIKTPFNNKTFFVDFKNMKIDSDYFLYDFYFNPETKFLSVVFSDSNNKLFFATKKNNDSRYRVSEIMIFDNDDEICCLPLLIDNYRLIYLKTDNTVMEYNFVENEK